MDVITEIIGEEIQATMHPNKYDVRERVMKKLEKSRTLRKIEEKDPYRYKVERYYPHHVLMTNEFGTRKCFTYSEVLWKMF